MMTKWDQARSQVGFSDCLGRAEMGLSRGKSSGWKSFECLQNLWVPCDLFPSDLFLLFLLGSVTELPSWHIERISIHLIPSQHCHIKNIGSSILPCSSQTQKLEGVCPGQSCSGLWLISGLRFSPLTFANQAVLTQHVRVIQSRRAVTSHGLFFTAQRRAWFIRNIFWSNHFRSQGNAV